MALIALMALMAAGASKGTDLNSLQNEWFADYVTLLTCFPFFTVHVQGDEASRRMHDYLLTQQRRKQDYWMKKYGKVWERVWAGQGLWEE